MKVMLILVGVLLAGCAAAPTSTAGSGHRVQPVCGAFQPSSDTVTLDGFVVSWVLRCPFRVNAGARVSERADGRATELVRQLTMPSGPRPEACAAIEVLRAPFALVDAAGNAIEPVLPTDGCQPRKAIFDALAALPFRAVESENR
ncbi:MAG TPA: hypothetical protein VGD48_03930 [Kutzneria sp.]